MTKEDLQNRIEQVAYDGTTNGYNQAVIEREAEKLATELVEIFDKPNISNRKELLKAFIEYHDNCDIIGGNDNCINNFLKTFNCC